MLTRFVRNQLIVFTVTSVVGLTVMLFTYMQVPTLLGIDRINVKLDLPTTGGLYRFSNVTYRGVQVGKVTAVDLTAEGARATLVLDTSPKIPADLNAVVRSVSAVGEVYVDLQPRNDSGPYLQDDSEIPVGRASVPQAVGPMLDQVSNLVASLPKDRLSDLLDETYKGFNGAAYDFGSLLDSSSTLTKDVNGVSDQTKSLIDDTGPLLDAQAQTADSIRTWARSLAGITQQLADDDPQIRTLLQKGPGFARETTQLLDQIKPTLPILLANLSTLGQVAIKYNPGLEQILVLLPPLVSSTQSYSGVGNATGLPLGEFALTVNDPPPCTVGFLPPTQWRSPADTTTVDTPDGIYCKLPQDSPIAVRGVRNTPCEGKPGKRAPTAEMCDSDQPFVPLAQRQHVLGPPPLDPNLISQGVPTDDRVSPGSNLYAPVEGTPLPADAASQPDGPPAAPPSVPAEAPPVTDAPVLPATVPGDETPPTGDVPSAAPSSFTAPVAGRPSVAAVAYNPGTGMYVTADDKTYTQTDLINPVPRSWKELMPQ